MCDLMDDVYICHYGVKGMHWGVITKKVSSSVKAHSDKRKAENEKRQQLKLAYREDKRPRRFGVLNAANSAARTYYRQQRTPSFSTYRSEGRKLDRRQARLTEDQIKSGRYRVAQARNFKRKTASVVLGMTTLGLLAGGYFTPIAPVMGLTVGTITNFASGGHYYAMEKRAYGDVRAKYQSKS